ncbi:MAG: hypothetical protein V3V53_00775, partial [Bacteroidales bacterium]
MKTIHLFFSVLIISAFNFSCAPGDSQREDEHPSIFLVKEENRGFTSLEDFDELERDERKAAFIKKLVSDTEKDFQVPYIDPTTDVEGRSPVHLKYANVSYDMSMLVAGRLSRSAFLFLYTGEQKYRDLVMRQIEALYDTILWPMWCDQAHVNIEPHLDIRTCR